MKLHPSKWSRLASLTIACTAILSFASSPTATAQTYEAFEAVADNYYPFAGSAYNGHFFYTPGLDPAVPAYFYGTDGFRWVADGPGSFVENGDGTASLTGLLKSQFYPTRGFTYDVSFTGRSNVPPMPGDGMRELLAFAYSESGGPVVVASWHYYTDYVGILNGTGDYAGGSIRIIPFMHSFQVGTGASGKNIQPGASGWFTWEVLSQPTNPAFTFRGSLSYSPPLFGDMNFNIRTPVQPPTGRLGDFVWKDLNANGIQNVGEPGINGVLVTLRDNNTNVLLDTTVTGPHPTILGQNGYYQFTGLTAGTYKVSVDNTSPALAGCIPTIVNAPGSTTANDSNTNPTTATLPTDSSEDQTLDFGYVAESPGFQLMKVANKTSVQPFEAVTYTYVVKNTGNTTLTNINVVDDNATPDFFADDFVVVTGLTLPPGTQQSFTVMMYPLLTMYAVINNVQTVVGTLIVQRLPNLDWRVFYRQSPNLVDNTYGINASPSWLSGHAFSDFTGTDKAQFRFRNGAGTTVLDLAIDYLSASGAYPSGYGSLGATGADGSVITGSVANVVSSTTTMTTNLNQSPAFYGYTTNSPAPPANFPTWDYADGYTLVVKNSTFGASGFKSVSVPVVHNSPAKIGSTNVSPLPCTTVAHNVAKGTAQSGTTTLLSQADATVTVLCPPPMVTYTATQGGWGAPPSGNNVGMLLKNNFSTVYPGGSVTIGGTFTAKFTSANAIEVFLPSGGKPARLTKNYVNPVSIKDGVLAGQVLALTLNVNFSNAGITPTGLATLKLKNTKLAGYTVAQVLALANSVLGGGPLPSGVSLSDLVNAVTTINENYDNGADKGNLIP